MGKDIVLGLRTKTWVIIILTVVLTFFFVFLMLPYILSMISSVSNKQPDQLTGLLDGVALIVGISGTIASFASIVMTFADKRRFNQEKAQMKALIDSVSNLHVEINNVAQNVDKTLEQNIRLGLALYEKNVIDFNPNLVEISVSTPKRPQGIWKAKEVAGEIELTAKDTK